MTIFDFIFAVVPKASLFLPLCSPEFLRSDRTRSDSNLKQCNAETKPTYRHIEGYQPRVQNSSSWTCLRSTSCWLSFTLSSFLPTSSWTCCDAVIKLDGASIRFSSLDSNFVWRQVICSVVMGASLPINVLDHCFLVFGGDFAGISNLDLLALSSSLVVSLDV